MLENNFNIIFSGFKNSTLLISLNYKLVVVYITKQYYLYFIFWFKKHYTKQMPLYIANLLIVSWGRVIFRGKGFRVRIFRSSGKITLNFGHSHWTKLYFGVSWDFLRLQRQNYLIFSKHQHNFLNFSKILPQIRLVNRYTLRGLRMRKQFVRKRFGKISQYVSSLH